MTKEAPFRSSLKRPPALIALLLTLTALIWIGWWIGGLGRSAKPVGSPALWHIIKGDHEAYLFGTIHAVPSGELWLSPQIQDAAARSDRLILEVTGLDAERRDRKIFGQLGRSAGLPKITARLGHEDGVRFREILARYPIALHGIDGYESWAAALLINAAASSQLSLSSNDAGEAVFARKFTEAGKPIQGLETIAGQLGLFDTLPITDQRILLAESVRNAGNAAALYQALYNSWARADLVRLQRQFLDPLARSPGLRRALIDDRNRRWASSIDADLRQKAGVAFIAVGAGHLIGRASLQARLAQLGWQIRRVQ